MRASVSLKKRMDSIACSRIDITNIYWLHLLTGFVKAMSNTYGILLITVLMGNGLVGLPRRLWHWADTERELNSLYMTVMQRTIDIDKHLWFKRLLNFISPRCGTSCDGSQYDVMLCYVILCYVIWYYVMLCYVMLCYDMLCYVMVCCVMICCVMIWYVMLCYVMLRYFIPYYIFC